MGDIKLTDNQMHAVPSFKFFSNVLAPFINFYAFEVHCCQSF